jgi:hypothetical protein
MVHKNDTKRVITSDKISLQTSLMPSEERGSLPTLSSTTGTPILTPGTLGDDDDDIGGCLLALENDLDVAQALLQEITLENLALDDKRRFDSLPTLTCHICSAQGGQLRIFKTAKALEDHASSPIHDIKAFRCPRLLFPQKSKAAKEIKSFNTLSGLIQHLETGACRGGRETFMKTMNFLREGVLPLEWRGQLFLQ